MKVELVHVDSRQPEVSISASTGSGRWLLTDMYGSVWELKETGDRWIPVSILLVEKK